MSIKIRPYEIGDEDELFDVIFRSKEHLSQWLPWCHMNYCKNDTTQWVDASINAWKTKTGFRYLITSSEKIVGSVGIEQVNTAHRVAELGYWVCSTSLGNGIATTAAKLAVLEAFKRQISRIEIIILPENTASICVAEKLGAVREGVFRNRLIHFGEAVDACIYSVIPSDFGV